jgi:cytochrome c-type biogenesis protein CcmH
MRRSGSLLVIVGGVLGLCVMAAGIVPLARGAAPASFQDLEESLTCQCGCGLTVHSCNHLQCGSALPLREEIRAQMDLGKGKEAILAYFSDKYGEKILSSPTTTGFNLVAWVTPFILVALGGIFVGVTLLRWSARGRPAAATESAAPALSRVASPYDKAMEKELKDFEA